MSYCDGVEALPNNVVGDALPVTDREPRPLEVGVHTIFAYVRLTITTANHRDRSIYFEPSDARTIGQALLAAADEDGALSETPRL